MKRTTLSTALLACLAGLLVTFSTTGCKKDKTDDPADPGCLLTRIDGNMLYAAYTYDNQNRVVRRQSDGWYATYTYGSRSIDIGYFSDNGGSLGSAICQLDASGNVESLEWPGEHVIRRMTYDADGYLARILNIDLLDQDTSITNYTVLDGDYVASETDSGILQQQFTYYTELNNTVPSENKDGVIHLFFFPFRDADGDLQVLPMGKRSKHLLKTFSTWGSSGSEYTFGLTYETNAEGYVTKAIYSDGAQEIPVEYEYDCQ